jgi:hypothetical protein
MYQSIVRFAYDGILTETRDRILLVGLSNRLDNDSAIWSRMSTSSVSPSM